VPFTAAELAAWLPTAGFERLPAAQIVKVLLEPTVAPVVKGSASEAKLKAEFEGVKAKFITKAPGSNVDVEFLKLQMSAKSQFKVDKASNKKLELSMESKIEKAAPVKGMPGMKKEAAKAGAEKFSEILTPLLQRALGKLAVPGYAGAGGFPFSQQKAVAPQGAAVAAWSKFSATP
jgi:hypothetical protein